jgi:hypothetical protein
VARLALEDAKAENYAAAVNAYREFLGMEPPPIRRGS